jgi:hypothetical protein
MTEIREYTSQDQLKFKKFYITIESKKKKTRVLHALQKSQSAKRTWQAGLVSILGLHFSHLLKAKLSLVLSTIPTILVELFLWSAGVGFVWYKWISKEYESKVQQATENMAKELANIQNIPKSNAWIMVNEDDEIVGTVALKYENGEGKLGYLTGEESRNRLLLVQNAIRFGRTNNIQVISKWGHEDSKWSESPL